MTTSSIETKEVNANGKALSPDASVPVTLTQPGEDPSTEPKGRDETTPTENTLDPTSETSDVQETGQDTAANEPSETYSPITEDEQESVLQAPVPSGAVANDEESDKDALGQYREQLQKRLDEELNTLETTQEQAKERLETEAEEGVPGSDDVDLMTLTADASQERADILSVVRSLERQTDTSAKFKDILEGEVEVLQKNLAKEKALRVDLEESLSALKGSDGSLPQLQEENETLKAECSRQKELLEEIRPQLASVTEGRDMLTEETAFAKKQARELAGRNAELETQVKHLQEKLSSAKHLRTEVSALTNQRQVSTEQVRKLMNRLEEANKMRDTLELDLSTAHEALCKLQRERQALKDAVTDDGTEVSRLRNQLLTQSTELATITEKLQLETAARRQTEEMLREVKSRLLSLSHNKSVASVLGAACE